MSKSQAETELANLRKQLEEANAKLAAKSKISFKIGEKKALSVYGLGRFPVTLYGNQWVRLLAEKDAILKFIEENRSKLDWKE